MYITQKSAPGPRGESCLTCRQRRKKCDKGRPFCERCLSSQGNFACLGYEDELRPGVERPKERGNARTRAAPVNIPFVVPQMQLGVDFEEAVSGYSTRSAYFGTPISASDINDYLTPTMDSLMVPGPLENLLLTAVPPNDQQDTRPAQMTSRYKPGNVTTLPWPVPIPRGVNSGAQMRQSYLVFMLGEYETHRLDMFFRQPSISLRGSLAAKVKRSYRTMGLLYLGARIIETINGKSEEVAINSCSQWITRYSHDISNQANAPNPYPSQHEVEDQLNRLLELVFLKLIVLGTSAGYSTLRLALPNFLRLVSDDPCLWAEQAHSGLLSVSLPATLISDRLEIRRFALYDVTYSLLLGLPTLAEYDLTTFSIMPGTEITVEWIHGVPVEFLVSIAEVHSWRAQVKYADWGVLEMRTLAWRWNQRDVHSEDSVEMVYRVAIQEAWRNVTLIYIYMGMCRATSHDPRVQASVQQIVKLVGVVGDSHLDVHFSIPSVIAGLAARYEPQRALILRKLKSFNGMRLWTLRGRDFARVLEHLWHGLAKDGAAVGWDDYLQSRSKVLPIL